MACAQRSVCSANRRLTSNYGQMGKVFAKLSRFVNLVALLDTIHFENYLFIGLDISVRRFSTTSRRRFPKALSRRRPFTVAIWPTVTPSTASAKPNNNVALPFFFYCSLSKNLLRGGGGFPYNKMIAPTISKEEKSFTITPTNTQDMYDAIRHLTLATVHLSRNVHHRVGNSQSSSIEIHC